ncbi:hypothetical protein N2152v2_006118 [Parachlorella kessleri]
MQQQLKPEGGASVMVPSGVHDGSSDLPLHLLPSLSLGLSGKNGDGGATGVPSMPHALHQPSMAQQVSAAGIGGSLPLGIPDLPLMPLGDLAAAGLGLGLVPQGSIPPGLLPQGSLPLDGDALMHALMQHQHPQQHAELAAAGLGPYLSGMLSGAPPFTPQQLPGMTLENPLPSIVVHIPPKNNPVSPMIQVPQPLQQRSPGGALSGVHSPEDHRTASGGSQAMLQQGASPTSHRNGNHKSNNAQANGTPRSRQSPGGASNGRDSALRSSKFRGVTKHRRSGRFEAHIWVKDLGRQVYLGGYDTEEHAAEAFDIAALKCKGRRTKTNFEVTKYGDLLDCIDRMTLEELIMAVRRQSKGFSRGSSNFRGVTRHPSGRWESRIGIPGSKHIYLGLFQDEREAARAYDRALVRLKGKAASTNFNLSDYRAEMADYHKLQAKSLKSDPTIEDIQRTPVLFERWVKTGCEGFPELASPTIKAEAAPPGDEPAESAMGAASNAGSPFAPAVAHEPPSPLLTPAVSHPLALLVGHHQAAAAHAFAAALASGAAGNSSPREGGADGEEILVLSGSPKHPSEEAEVDS